MIYFKFGKCKVLEVCLCVHLAHRTSGLKADKHQFGDTEVVHHYIQIHCRVRHQELNSQPPDNRGV